MFGASKSGSAVIKDPQFNYVVALLNGDGTNGAQNNTFLDSSTNNATITRFGNATQGSFTPYNNTWSNYFNGSTAYLSVANSVTNQMGSGDWTAEAWIYLNNYSLINPIFGKGGTTTDWFLGTYVTTGRLYFGIGLTDYFATTGPVVPLNTWCHVALVRSGTTLTTYLNGVVGNTQAGITQNFASAGTLNIGRGRDTSANYLAGYISNARLVKGTAVYTANFTPPTMPLTAITNTSLLTCQSNRFIDNSTNALTLTATGNPSIQKFSPFSPTAYTTSGNSGSAYFDGNGDYLQTSTYNSNLNPSSSDFTIEFWVYATASSRQDWFNLQASTGFNRILIYYTSTGNVQYDSGVGSAAASRISAAVSSTVLLNQWHHVALSRNSGSSRLFFDGVQIGSTYADTQVWTNALQFTTGRDPGGTTYVSGNISNMRFLIGTGLYTANFMPPTTPLTAITNTALLLNGTNAGIYDSAMMIDYETVGNAQVSTTVQKFGTGSMAFDGTGDWLIAPDSFNQQLGTGDFTIEGWVYLSAIGVAYGIVSKGAATTGWSVGVTSANKLQFAYTATSLTGATSLAASTWYYFTVVRSGTATGNLKIYLNGVVDATSAGAVTDNFNQTTSIYVGASRTATTALNGYVDDLRITKGYARYTTNFTPPTQPLPTS